MAAYRRSAVYRFGDETSDVSGAHAKKEKAGLAARSLSAKTAKEGELESESTCISFLTGRDPTSKSWVKSGFSPFLIRWRGGLGGERGR